jgi:hypothetical protein
LGCGWVAAALDPVGVRLFSDPSLLWAYLLPALPLYWVEERLLGGPVLLWGCALVIARGPKLLTQVQEVTPTSMVVNGPHGIAAE